MIALSLYEITAANWRATLNLTVHPDQQRFIANHTPIAAIVLAKAYVRSGGFHWIPYAIAIEQTLVGLLALAYQPNSPDTYWLFHFFIDHHYQGQGYGTAALSKLFDLLNQNHHTCRKLKLTVHPDNKRAQQLYTHLGFETTDEWLDGEPVYRRILLSKNHAE